MRGCQIPGACRGARAPKNRTIAPAHENRRQEVWDKDAETALLPETCKRIEMESTGALQSIEIPGDLGEIADIARRFDRVQDRAK
jgi:hypothetical protein